MPKKVRLRLFRASSSTLGPKILRRAAYRSFSACVFTIGMQTCVTSRLDALGSPGIFRSDGLIKIDQDWSWRTNLEVAVIRFGGSEKTTYVLAHVCDRNQCRVRNVHASVRAVGFIGEEQKIGGQIFTHVLCLAITRHNPARAGE